VLRRVRLAGGTKQRIAHRSTAEFLAQQSHALHKKDLTSPTVHVYTCFVGTQNPVTDFRGSLPTLPCACANLRRAARAVTRLYNQQLRSGEIEITQFTILTALDRAGEISQGKLGKLLALDSTTLTRMLALLRKRGWIQEKEGEDRRFQLIRLTSAGRAKLRHSLRHWKRAQDRMQSALGEDTLRQLTSLLAQVTVMIAGA
jgi:DNA-binding MarR family transcriptional regulator